MRHPAPHSDFGHRVEVRNTKVDGVGPWFWLNTDGHPAGDGGAWVGPSEDFPDIKREALKYVGDRRGVCVQAGGCLGMYPRLWSQYFDTVYTFEPDPVNFHILTLNCQSERIVKFNTALGSSNRVTMHEVTPWNAGAHNATEEPGSTILAVALDSLPLPGLDLLQLDVEGYELVCLGGAYNTIKKYQPVIVAEADNHEKITQRTSSFLRDVLLYEKVAELRYDNVWIYKG